MILPQAFGTNISAQFAPGNPNGAPESAEADGTIFKVTGSWSPDNNQMYYVTVSEGFRARCLVRVQ